MSGGICVHTKNNCRVESMLIGSKSQYCHQPDAKVAIPAPVAKPAPPQYGINVNHAIYGRVTESYESPGAMSKIDIA